MRIEQSQNTVIAKNSGFNSNNLEDYNMFNLEDRLQYAKDQQGLTGIAVDKLKSIFNQGSEKLEKELKEVETEEDKDLLLAKIEKYENNQEAIVNNLGSWGATIIAPVAATALAAMFLPATLGVAATSAITIGIGALVGGCVKYAISFLGDEATNKIKGDATFKQGINEAASGGYYGAVSTGIELLHLGIKTKNEEKINLLKEKNLKRLMQKGKRFTTRVKLRNDLNKMNRLAYVEKTITSGFIAGATEPAINQILYNNNDDVSSAIKNEGVGEFAKEFIPFGLGELFD